MRFYQLLPHTQNLKFGPIDLSALNETYGSSPWWVLVAAGVRPGVAADALPTGTGHQAIP